MSGLDPRVLAAYGLQLEERTARVVGLLDDAGVEVVVLKGVTFAHLLYPDGLRGRSADVDVLVPHDDLDRASQALLGVGFERLQVVHDLTRNHARTFVRRGEGGSEWVDMHWNMHGSTADPGRAWTALTRETATVPTGHGDLRALSAAGRALHTALHAARAGLADKREEDLARAVTLLPTPVWTEALDLARELEVEPAMAFGLRFLPTGAELASELGLTEELPPPWLFGARQLPRGSVVVLQVLRERSPRALLAALRSLRVQSSGGTTGAPRGPGERLRTRATYLRTVVGDLPAAVRSGRALHREWDTKPPHDGPHAG